METTQTEDYEERIEALREALMSISTCLTVHCAQDIARRAIAEDDFVKPARKGGIHIHWLPRRQ